MMNLDISGKFLFSVPRWDIDHLRHLALQTPTYFLTFLPRAVRSLWDLLHMQVPSQQHCIRYILDTSLALLVRTADEVTFELSYRDSKMRKLDDLRKFKDLRVVFTLDEIKTFELNGEPISDPEDMLGILVIFLSCGTHTKSHIMGERSVREIRDKGIKELRRSTWTTLSTDHAVLNSMFSPIRSNMYGFHMDIDSLIEESKNNSTIGHNFLRTKSVRHSQLFSFLVRAREILGEHLRRRGIPANLEYLFNSMIVHPVDHYMAYRGLAGLRFSCSHVKTTWLVFRSFLFRHIFLRGVLNPLFPNLISTINEPFYQDLYRDLAAVDPELAEHVTACVMY
jgi:hypothetical protein